MRMPSRGDWRHLPLSHSDRAQRPASRVWRIPRHSPICGHGDVQGPLRPLWQRAYRHFQLHGRCMKFLRPHMRIKNLNLTESWVRHEDTCGRLADEPIPSENVERGTVQRVGMYSRSHYWKSREYCQTCSEGTTTTETVRCVVQRMWSCGHHL